jgi:hypothetical protein
MRDGNPGVYGNPGNMVSVSYRFYSTLKGSNPTLTANFHIPREGGSSLRRFQPVLPKHPESSASAARMGLPESGRLP